MSRKKKLLLNTCAGILKQVITVVCGFILPRFMLLYYGSSVNGLVSSISNFLSFIYFLDMGVGSVIQANLYKPLVDQDHEKISMLIKASERFFRKLAYIFSAYILVLCFVLPKLVDTRFDWWYTASLVLIISVSTLGQYLLGNTYLILLNADQRAYVYLTLQIGTIVLNTVLSIILMKMGASIHAVKLMTAIVYILRPIGQALYVKKHYKIDRSVKLVGEPIKQKWNGFSQHFAAVVCQNIDVAVLTVFSTLENVSIYSVYYNVTSGVDQILLTAATGLEPLFGNMIARGEKSELDKTFNCVEWLVHTLVCIVFFIAAFTIVPFVTVYTKGVTDANYRVPLFGFLLVIAYAAQCMRIPYQKVVKAAGHFKQTQNGAYISAGLNIVITIALVFKYGLIGAALGTFVAMMYHTCYFVWYLRKSILERPAKYFIGYILTDLVIFGASYAIARVFTTDCENYLDWIILAIKSGMVVLAVSAVVNLVFYRKPISDIMGMLRGRNKHEG